MPIYYIWPAVAALIYALAAIITKRALVEGSGVVRFTFVCNAGFLIIFLVPAAINWEPIPWNQIGWPILGGFSFFLGQLLTILAIKVGDVSIQSPLMGSKVIFVALIATIIGAEHVQPAWWAGAGLTTLAVFLLGFSSWREGKKTWIGIGTALLASATYALSDVLVSAKAGAFGVENYLFIVMAAQLAFSLALIPLFNQPLTATPRKAWKWLLVASGLMGLQAIILNTALGYYPHATAFNVIYSSRGLWSVLLIWWIGSQLGNQELAGGKRLLVQRLVGAGLLLAAVGLVLRSS